MFDSQGTASGGVGVLAGFVPPPDWEPIPDEVFAELGSPPWLEDQAAAEDEAEPPASDSESVSDDEPETSDRIQCNDADRFVLEALGGPVGAQTLGLLTVTPFGELSAAGRTHALQQLERLGNQLEAVKLELIAAIAGPEPGPDAAGREGGRSEDYAAHEIALATTCSVYAAEVKVHVARELAARRPATAAAMARGEISYPQVRALCEASYALDEQTAAQLEAAVIDGAAVQSLAEFKASLTRWAARLDPDWTTNATTARRDCAVEHTAGPDGTGELFVRGPLEITTPISMTLTRYAATHRDTLGGTLAQRKLAGLRELAERYLDSPEAGTLHGRPPTVVITVDAATLLGLADHPAEIPGIGPIPADAARWLLADGAPLRRMLLEETTGRCLDYGRTSYTVPPELAEHLIALHVHSAGPHSRVPASGCDLDHRIPYADGGATSTLNLTPLDRRWHRAKTHAGWTYVKNPDTDTITWTSPTGLTARIDPYDYRSGP
ncbi:MAG TPA: DUF222 domain-containing protein [Mycobacteriales bacterium]|nr:DUF222 domain-containing protein [Mycobacteriales bacterium]